MEIDKNLPIYELTVDEVDEGVNFVALVDVPAIEKPFMAFAKAPSVEFKKAAQAKYKFSETGERRVLTGPLMIPDTPIFRSDSKGEYYVIFSKETIRKIVQKYFKQGNQHNVNANHSYELDGVFMFESYLTDASRGILPPMGYEGTPDGSWFGSFKVENDEIWANREAFKGFSVEGLFGMKEEVDESTLKEIQMAARIAENILSQNCTKSPNRSSFSMSIKTALQSLRTELQKFGTSLKLNFADYTLGDGTVIRIDGELVAGTAVYVLTETGAIPAPDGEHAIPDVGTVVVAGGVITEIRPAEMEVEVETKIPVDPEVLPLKAEIAPEAGQIIADKVKEGYPEIDPEIIDQVVQKHLIAIMEELKAAYTQLGWMKEKMSMFSSQITILKEEVKAMGEKPQAQPQNFSSPHAGIVSAQKAKTLENFNQLTKTLKK